MSVEVESTLSVVNLTSTDSSLSDPFSNNASLYYSIQSSDPDLRDCQQTILNSQIRAFLEWKWWIGGVAMSGIAAIGLCGNLMSIAVLTRPQMRSLAFNQLLAVLCIVDSIFILCNAMTCGRALGVKKGFLQEIAKYVDVFTQVSMCASVLLIVALTFERHFAIMSPHKYRVHIRTTAWWKHLAMYVVPVTLLSIIFNVPIFINLQGSWMKDLTYLRVNLYLRMFHPLTTTGLAPIVILIILNVRITRGIIKLQERAQKLKGSSVVTARKASTTPATEQNNKNNPSTTNLLGEKATNNSNSLQAVTAKRQNRSAQQNRREIRMAYIAFAIVAIFFCLNLPRFLVGGYEVSDTWVILHCVEAGFDYLPGVTFYRADLIARLLMVLNSAVNFLIYCAGSQQFKSVFCSLFLPQWCQPKIASTNRANIDTRAENGTNTQELRLKHLDEEEEEEEEHELEESDDSEEQEIEVRKSSIKRFKFLSLKVRGNSSIATPMRIVDDTRV